MHYIKTVTSATTHNALFIHRKKKIFGQATFLPNIYKFTIHNHLVVTWTIMELGVVMNCIWNIKDNTYKILNPLTSIPNLYPLMYKFEFNLSSLTLSVLNVIACGRLGVNVSDISLYSRLLNDISCISTRKASRNTWYD